MRGVTTRYYLPIGTFLLSFVRRISAEFLNFQDMHKSKDVYDIDAPQVA